MWSEACGYKPLVFWDFVTIVCYIFIVNFTPGTNSALKTIQFIKQGFLAGILSERVKKRRHFSINIVHSSRRLGNFVLRHAYITLSIFIVGIVIRFQIFCREDLFTVPKVGFVDEPLVYAHLLCRPSKFCHAG